MLRTPHVRETSRPVPFFTCVFTADRVAEQNPSVNATLSCNVDAEMPALAIVSSMKEPTARHSTCPSVDVATDTLAAVLREVVGMTVVVALMLAVETE